jgi:hypothetical protein
MGTSTLNVWLRDYNCTLMNNCWMLDLAVQACNGVTLYERFPLVEQLKERYSSPAMVTEYTDFSTISDQSGKTLEVTVSGGSMQSLVFSGSAITLKEIFSQMESYFTDVVIKLMDGHISITTEDYGHDVNLTIGGSCDLVWGTITQGFGYKISTRYYHGANRINIRPPDGEYVNHIEMDVPPGCYKIFARACHRGNDDTFVVMEKIDNCGECHTVDLLLPEFPHCAGGIIYPFMDRVVNDYGQIIKDDFEKVVVFKAIARGANIAREQILVELAERKQDALDMGMNDAASRTEAVIAVAQQLPQCY